MNKWLWLLIIVIFDLVITVFIIPNELIIGECEKEQEVWQRLYTDQIIEKIVDQATNTHQELLINSGFTNFVYIMFIPSKQDQEKSGVLSNLGKGLFSWLDHRFNLMSYFAFEIICRVMILKLWYKVFLILLIMSSLSGLWRRKIKQTNFELSSAIRENYAFKVFELSIIAFLFLLFAPIYINFNILMLLWVVSCVMLGVVLANLQKRI